MSTNSIPDQSDVESACNRLIIDFANNLDRRDYPRVLQLFTHDATLDRAGLVMHGLDEISGFLEQRPEQVTTRHLCTNISVRPRGDDVADGICCIQFFQSSSEGGHTLPAKASATAVVDYLIGFVRQHDRWRIKDLRIRPVFQG